MSPDNGRYSHWWICRNRYTCVVFVSYLTFVLLITIIVKYVYTCFDFFVHFRCIFSVAHLTAVLNRMLKLIMAPSFLNAIRNKEVWWWSWKLLNIGWPTEKALTIITFIKDFKKTHETILITVVNIINQLNSKFLPLI